MSETPTNRAIGIERTLRTLMRSKNPAAKDALIAAISTQKSSQDEPLSVSQSALSLGAVRALALRDDFESHRELTELSSKLSSELRAALSETVADSTMAKSLEKLIASSNRQLSLQATDIALSGRVVTCLPALVEKTRQADAESIAIFAQSTLGLAQELYSQVEQSLAGKIREGQDPAFARRSSVNALNKAIGTYAEHQRKELIEALFLLSPFDEPILQQVLISPRHPAHHDMLVMLETSTSPAVARILAHSLQEASTRKAVLDIVASRIDLKTMGGIFGHIKLPVSLRVRENAARIESFAWLDDSLKTNFDQLNDHQKEVALVLGTSSKSPRQDVARMAEQLLNDRSEAAQLAACWAIAKLPGRFSNPLIQSALQSKFSSVVAEATSLLGNATDVDNESSLIELLDHEDEEVRQSAQEALPDINYANFRDQYANMSAVERFEAGELVRKGDPQASDSLKSELHAAAVSRRLKGLEMIELMGLLDTMSEEVIGRLEDTDVGVRVEAARMLGGAEKTSRVLTALAAATVEKSPAVRVAAEESASRLDALDEIERLIEVLMLEERR